MSEIPTNRVRNRIKKRLPAMLVLADGTVFEGEAAGALTDGKVTIATGEVVFNTALSGYQEIITDPSYAGQIIAFTYPHIGNYGVTLADEEARRPFCRGIIVRDLARESSNWRATQDLDAYLIENNIAVVSGIDTRRLTRHIREVGAMSCAIGTASEAELLAAAKAEPGTLGADLVAEVTTEKPYSFDGAGSLRIVAYDFGIKKTMLDQLTQLGSLTVVPASTTAAEVLAMSPNGVMLSNGPGDPAALSHIVKEVKGLLGNVPIFGICLGHQLLASALGAKTYKLSFGHHGANHPVQRVASGEVEITSQNHGYAVSADSLQDAEITHLNLNDGVVEGLRCTSAPAFSVQYHPEAGPGPHDARYLFDDFRTLMETHQ